MQKILGLMDSDLEPVVLDEASHEIRAQFLSAAKARDALGWAPLFSLDEGLRRTHRVVHRARWSHQ